MSDSGDGAQALDPDTIGGSLNPRRDRTLGDGSPILSGALVWYHAKKKANQGTMEICRNNFRVAVLGVAFTNRTRTTTTMGKRKYNYSKFKI